MTTSTSSSARPDATRALVKSSKLVNQANTNVSGDTALSDAERRHAMIAEAAYLLAEQWHFEVGHDVEDWLAAESALPLALIGRESQRNHECPVWDVRS